MTSYSGTFPMVTYSHDPPVGAAESGIQESPA
jgi:hypothetical protein